MSEEERERRMSLGEDRAPDIGVFLGQYRESRYTSRIRQFYDLYSAFEAQVAVTYLTQ